MKRSLILCGTIFLFFLSSVFSKEAVKEVTIPMIKSPYSVTSTSWSKDGYKFAYPEDRRVLIRRASDYALIQTIYTANGKIDFIHFPPETMGENQDQLATLSKNNILETRILPDSNVINTVKLNQDATPTALGASQNGNYIATGSNDGIINLFLQNYMTKTLIQYPLRYEESGNVKYMDFSPDHKKLIAAYQNDIIILWDVPSKKSIGKIPYKSEFDVPVIFSSDSKYFFTAKSKRIMGMYDLEGNEVKKITSKAAIKSMTISPDGKTLIILGANNMFYYYNLETAKLEKYIPAFNKSPITSFAFTNTHSKLLIGHEDGSLYIVKTSEVLLNPGEKSPVYKFEDISNKKAPEEKEDEIKEKKTENIEEKTNQEQPAQTPQNNGQNQNPANNQGQNQTQQKTNTQPKTQTKVSNSVVRRLLFPDMDPHSKTEHEIPISVGAGTAPSPYNITFSIEAGYLNYGLLFPFYFGGMIKPSLSIAFTDYPYTYTNIESGKVLRNPFLTGAKVYVPAGFTFFPFNSDFEMFTQLQIGASFNLIWNGNIGSQGITSKVYPAFYGGLKIGAGYRYFQIAVCEEYDVLTGFAFSGEIGVRIGF